MSELMPLLDRIDRLEMLILREGVCTKDKDIRIEIEKIRGEIRAINERDKVREGLINSNIVRLSDRMDRQAEENKTLKTQVTAQDATHSAEITKINMAMKYSLGAFAALVFLLNFFDKIREFLGAMLPGSRP